MYELDENMKPVNSMQFLGDEETVKKAIESVAAQVQGVPINMGIEGSVNIISTDPPLIEWHKIIMQGKFFQRCMHLLYCSVLSLGGNVNTRRMSQPYMGSMFHIKYQ